MKPHKPRNSSVRDALKRAASQDDPASRDFAYSLALRQKEAQSAPTVRSSPGYDRFMADKGRRIAGAAVALHAQRPAKGKQ